MQDGPIDDPGLSISPALIILGIVLLPLLPVLFPLYLFVLGLIELDLDGNATT